MSGIIIIDPEKCKGCYLCILYCPHNLIEISKIFNTKSSFPAEYVGGSTCPGKGCDICATNCPDIAITVLKEEKGGGDDEETSKGQ